MNWKELLAMRHWVMLAGVLHFCQIPSMMMYPRLLGWKDDLEKLRLMNQRIIKVIGMAIMIVVVGLGIVVSTASGELVNGTRLATELTGFLAVFWAYRGGVQFVLYMKIWPKGWLGNVTNYGLAFLFSFLTVVYLAAFIANLSG